MYDCRKNALFKLGERFTKRRVQYTVSPARLGAFIAEIVDHIDHLFRVGRSRLAFVFAQADFLSTKVSIQFRAFYDVASRLGSS